MTVVNIRGTSGAGKSTLVHRFLKEHPHIPLHARLGPWAKEKIVGYKVETSVYSHPTYVLGRYQSQCGGWDAMSYKGSHVDLQEMLIDTIPKGNVIVEGLTLSSSYGRMLNVSLQFPGAMVFAFMDTPEEICYQRILARNGGREPKRDARGQADYNRKYRNCIVQAKKLKDLGERVIYLSSDDAGYQKLLEVLD